LDMNGEKYHKKKASFLSTLWSEASLKFIANAIVLLLTVCLVQLLIAAYKFIVVHFQCRVTHILSEFSFDSCRIPGLLGVILGIWIIVSLLAVGIDYFIIYPIRCKRVKKRAANGTSE